VGVAKKAKATRRKIPSSSRCSDSQFSRGSAVPVVSLLKSTVARASGKSCHIGREGEGEVQLTGSLVLETHRLRHQRRSSIGSSRREGDDGVGQRFDTRDVMVG
jgi:hypothetical protein